MGNLKLHDSWGWNLDSLYCAWDSYVKQYWPRRNWGYILGRRPFQSKEWQDDPTGSQNKSSNYSLSQLKWKQEFLAVWRDCWLLCLGYPHTRFYLVFECVSSVVIFITAKILFFGMRIRYRFGPVTIVWSSYLIYPSSTLQFLVVWLYFSPQLQRSYD